MGDLIIHQTSLKSMTIVRIRMFNVEQSSESCVWWAGVAAVGRKAFNR